MTRLSAQQRLRAASCAISRRSMRTGSAARTIGRGFEAATRLDPGEEVLALSHVTGGTNSPDVGRIPSLTPPFINNWAHTIAGNPQAHRRHLVGYQLENTPGATSAPDVLAARDTLGSGPVTPRPPRRPAPRCPHRPCCRPGQGSSPGPGCAAGPQCERYPRRLQGTGQCRSQRSAVRDAGCPGRLAVSVEATV